MVVGLLAGYVLQRIGVGACIPPVVSGLTIPGRSVAPQTAMNLQEKIALPTMSVSDFTDSLPMSSESSVQELHFLTSSRTKHWEMMSMIFSQSNCRIRNLYLGTCCMMRTLSNLERLLLQNPHQLSKARISELESECMATVFSIPAWVNNPVRNYTVGETEQDHRYRLDALFIWSWWALPSSCSPLVWHLELTRPITCVAFV